MARIYKIGKVGKILSGDDLVKYAKGRVRKWNYDNMLSIKSSNVSNVKKAISYIERYDKKTVFTRMESETKWKSAWIWGD